MPFLIFTNPAVSGTIDIDVNSYANLTRAQEAAETRFLAGPMFTRAMFTTGSSFTVNVDNTLSSSSDGTTLVYSEDDDLVDWSNRLGPPGW